MPDHGGTSPIGQLAQLEGHPKVDGDLIPGGADGKEFV